MADSFENANLPEDHSIKITIEGEDLPTAFSPSEASSTDALHYKDNLALFLAVIASIYEQRSLDLNWRLSQSVRVLPSSVPPPDVLFASEVLEPAHPNHVAQGAFVMHGSGDLVKSMYGFPVHYYEEKRIREAVCGAQYWKDVHRNFYALQLDTENKR